MLNADSAAHRQHNAPVEQSYVGSARPHTTPEPLEWTEAAVGGRGPELGVGGTVDLIVPDAGVPPRNTVRATLLYSGQSVVTSLDPVALYPAELLSGGEEAAFGAILYYL